VHGAAAQGPAPEAEPLLLRTGALVVRRGPLQERHRGRVPGEGKVVTSEIRDKDEIYDAIKRFLGEGL
jgi:hypothetical protein